MKIHIFGASGSGVSTLGERLAFELKSHYFDADDFYWQKTNPPFRVANPLESRVKLLCESVLPHQAWVLSGTLVSWGDCLKDQFDLAIYLYVPKEERLKRVVKREIERFGGRIEKGGDMYESHLKFLNWLSQYDDGHMGGRSKAKHEAWMKTLKCPILRIEGTVTVEESLSNVIRFVRE